MGISGFESSANYIEEQREGVFPKTLRNMWIAVVILNPSISLLSWCVLPAADILQPSLSASLLSRMAQAAGGIPLMYVIVINATMVLSGALLTSFVGVGGLIKRMSSDRVLPNFLLKVNPLRKTHHFIILLFLLICVSVFALVQGDVTVLSVVYTICFLAVMSLFALGNMLLKYKRGRMPRATRSWWITVLFAFVMVVIGLVTNVVTNLGAFGYFAIYYLVTMVVVGVMFMRIRMMKMLLFFGVMVLKNLPRVQPATREKFERKLQQWIRELGDFSVVFFSKDDNMATINKAILYCRDNESATIITIVHAYEKDEDRPARLEHNVKVLGEAYPYARLPYCRCVSHYPAESTS